MKNTLIWLGMGLLIITNVVTALLLFNEMAPDEKRSDTPVAAALGEETEDEVAEVPEAQASQEATASVVQEPTRTEYDSNVGKFSLDLDGKYRVIVENDGGADSSKSTVLKIGRRNPEQVGIVRLGSNDYVKVEAYPSESNGTRDQFVTADTALQGNAADESASTVDGQTARKFKLSGVGDTVKYYFERSGVTYFIEAWDVSSGDTQLMVDDVVRGFSFN